MNFVRSGVILIFAMTAFLVFAADGENKFFPKIRQKERAYQEHPSLMNRYELDVTKAMSALQDINWKIKALDPALCTNATTRSSCFAKWAKTYSIRSSIELAFQMAIAMAAVGFDKKSTTDPQDENLQFVESLLSINEKLSLSQFWIASYTIKNEEDERAFKEIKKEELKTLAKAREESSRLITSRLQAVYQHISSKRAPTNANVDLIKKKYTDLLNRYQKVQEKKFAF